MNESNVANFMPSAPPIHLMGNSNCSQIESENMTEKLINLRANIRQSSSDIFRLMEIQAEVESIISDCISQQPKDDASAQRIAEIFRDQIDPTQQAITRAIESFQSTPETEPLAYERVCAAIHQLGEKSLAEKKSTIAICRSVMEKYPTVEWINLVESLSMIEDRIVEEPIPSGLVDVVVPLIGEKMALEAPIAGYNSCRNVKGGGGCYYRSIMFRLLEQVLDPSNLNRFAQCHEIANSLEMLSPGNSLFCFEDMSVDSIQNRVLIDQLRQAAEGKIWTTVEEFQEDFVKDTLSIDVALEKSARHLLANFIMGIADQYYDPNTGLFYPPNNGIGYYDKDGKPLLQVAVLMGCYAPDQMINFCRGQILPMDAYAEGVPVNLGFLAHIFQFSLVSVSDSVNFRVGKGPEVAVQLIGDHYRILYPEPVVKGELAVVVNDVPAFNSKSDYKIFLYGFAVLCISLFVIQFMKMVKGPMGANA
jgi:hypothetical protein